MVCIVKFNSLAVAVLASRSVVTAVATGSAHFAINVGKTSTNNVAYVGGKSQCHNVVLAPVCTPLSDCHLFLAFSLAMGSRMMRTPAAGLSI